MKFVTKRTMTRTVVAGLAAVLSLSTMAINTAASAQLGDVAKKEEARRKAVKTPSKVYTNDNLKPDTSSPPPPVAAGSQAPASTPDASQPAPAPEPAAAVATAQGEAFWKKRMFDARDTLDRAKTFADALQVQINSLTNDFASRDDPAQRAKIGADRDRALAQLARLQQEIAADTKAIAAVEEDARKAGVPAAWVR